MIIRECKWARPSLARIALRKQLGREPTKEEVEDQIEKINDRTVPPPSGETIIAAFENGEEVSLLLAFRAHLTRLREYRKHIRGSLNVETTKRIYNGRLLSRSRATRRTRKNRNLMRRRTLEKVLDRAAVGSCATDLVEFCDISYDISIGSVHSCIPTYLFPYAMLGMNNTNA